ncbi:MAG: DUF192 domain-containing protein [Patescibacteria group bacterium]
MQKGILTTFFVILALIGVVMIANYSISIHAVPNLGEYLASTTPTFATQATSTVTESRVTLGVATSTASTTIRITPNIVKEPTIPLKTSNKKIIHVIVATTTEAMSLGLGERASLPSNYGMLFIFASAGKPGFWMKGMQFPIDIVWVDGSKKVVGIASDVSVQSYPDLYFPPVPVSYVLEINSGAVKNFGIATGTKLTF